MWLSVAILCWVRRSTAVCVTVCSYSLLSAKVRCCVCVTVCSLLSTKVRHCAKTGCSYSLLSTQVHHSASVSVVTLCWVWRAVTVRKTGCSYSLLSVKVHRCVCDSVLHVLTVKPWICASALSMQRLYCLCFSMVFPSICTQCCKDSVKDSCGNRFSKIQTHKRLRMLIVIGQHKTCTLDLVSEC